MTAGNLLGSLACVLAGVAVGFAIDGALWALFERGQR